MMAFWVTSRALLLVLLAGAGYSYPVNQGFDPSSSSSYDADSAPADYNWEDVPSSGALASSSSTGPRSSQPAPKQGMSWAVAPPSRLSGDALTRPSTGMSASRKNDPEHLGPSDVHPLGPVLPEFQAGELSHLERSFEHGNSESETEQQGFHLLPPGVPVITGQASSSQLQLPDLGGSWVDYPYPYPYDYMFLTGQYPPGTYSHFSSSFEQGRDHGQDTHYRRVNFPASPSQQVPFHAAFGYPRSIRAAHQVDTA